MFPFSFDSRPIWLTALIGGAFGAAGQILAIALGQAGFAGPVVTFLVPAIVGLVAAVVIRTGWGAVGLAVGMVLAAPGVDIMPLTVGIVCGLLGYATGFGIAHQGDMGDFRPPAPADVARVEADVRQQLRSIDPQAPGAFERATVLLRKVNEQAGMFGMWGGPRPTNEDAGPPSGLLELQAELVETARLAAMAAGARRVTITSNGMGGGIDIQAVFGDPISPDEPLPPVALDVD